MEQKSLSVAGHKILVVLTGGTIGSFGDADGLCRDVDTKGAKRLLFQRFRNSGSEFADCELEDEVVLDTLSEHMTMGHMTKLVAYFREKDLSPYKGILITHGTDTLAYTAAFFSYLFWDVGCPVFFISSACPLTEPGANGAVNFQAAVECIHHGIKNGCYVPYRNMDGKMYLHSARELRSCQEYSDDFLSRSAVELPVPVTKEALSGKGLVSETGKEENLRESVLGENVFVNDVLKEEERKEHFLEDNARKRNDSMGGMDFSNLGNRVTEVKNDVLLIFPYTGLDYSRIVVDENVSAVVHALYHAQTSCTIKNPDGSYPVNSVLYFLEKCAKQHIPCFFSPLREEALNYASAQAMITHGGTGIYGLTIEAAYMKAVLGTSLGLSGKELVEFMRGMGGF